jgi:hypothetical protein
VLYHPARQKVGWTNHGQISSGRALTVAALVALNMGRVTISSPGMPPAYLLVRGFPAELPAG